MTVYLVTVFDEDPDEHIPDVVSGDKLDMILAEYRMDQDVPDGAGILVRKADYLARAGLRSGPVRGHLRLVVDNTQSGTATHLTVNGPGT